MSSMKFLVAALAAEAGIAWAALTTGSRMTPFADNGSLLRDLNSRIAARRDPSPGPGQAPQPAPGPQAPRPGTRDRGVASVSHADLWPRLRSRTVRSPGLVSHPLRARGDNQS